MKVLIVGSGGREHTLAWACSRSPLNPQITCAPGNGGTDQIARNVDISADNTDELVDFVRDQRFDLTIVGPEAPLVNGLADGLIAYGYPVFGPDKDAARIEGSKIFAKNLMVRANVPTAEFSVHRDASDAEKYLKTLKPPVVIKADGLAAGKGVIICSTIEDAVNTSSQILMSGLFGKAGETIIVEECLVGREMSLLALVDGENFLLLPPSRDHKRAYDYDKGPNTGGMGAYSPLDDIDDDKLAAIAESIYPPVLREMSEMGLPFQGVLYAGLMITENGPYVLEFNCRFGDPEAQAVLPLLTVDLLELMAEAADGGLSKWISTHNHKMTDWRALTSDMHAATVVAVADGYPGKYEKGLKIESMPDEDADVIPFHAGTTRRENKLVTSGGRVIAVTGLGSSHSDAVEKAYRAVELVKFEGVRYRTDIGRQTTLK